jgi:hypothetical protein
MPTHTLHHLPLDLTAGAYSWNLLVNLPQVLSQTSLPETPAHKRLYPIKCAHITSVAYCTGDATASYACAQTSNMGKGNFEKNIWPSKIKRRMADPHQSTADGSV